MNYTVRIYENDICITVGTISKEQAIQIQELVKKPQQLLKIGQRVFHKKEEQIVTIVNTIGFVKDGKSYIPCADSNNNIDDYREEDLISF